MSKGTKINQISINQNLTDMADFMTEVNNLLNPKNNTMVEQQNTLNAATLGLGFHQFDGNVTTAEVLNEIGGNFKVEEQSIARLPKSVIDSILNGEAVTIDPRYIIGSHKATVCVEQDSTIGVVGKDYGVVQNTEAFQLLDLMCNASVTDSPLSIVSAGRVRDFEPYIQAELPTTATTIVGDNSDTKFYCFVRTSHDGTCGLQVRFSPVRVICQNTFMANVCSKGLTYKHTKNIGSRVDLTKEANIKRVQEVLTALNIMQKDYIEQMNSFAIAKVTDEQIEEYVMSLFIDEAKLRDEARKHNYNLDLVEGVSTRTKNVIDAFRDTLESGIGQDTNRGTKLWLFNGTTNYFSNVANYGSKKDNDLTIATKRFSAMEDGKASKKVEKALALLTA